MSVTEVVTELRRVYALLTKAHDSCLAADVAIDEGATAFLEVTRGSIRPHVEQARALAIAAGESVRLSLAGIREVQEIVDAYCVSIAGHGLAPVPPAAAREVPSGAVDSMREDAGVARDEGDHVARTSRGRDGRVVRLPGDDRKKGLEHILDPDRVDQFARVRLPRDKILDLVFAALERGTVIGYSGRDRPVYEVEFEGELRRIAITVTAEGEIIGAHPISMRRKVRSRVYRR